MAQLSSQSCPTSWDDPSSLKLLSLDGGGIRGLSSLIILRHLMKRINPNNPPKPFEYFDLIGGTSTGGLIAIMLGRLKMSVDECIQKYLSLSAEAFRKKRSKVDVIGRAKSLWKAEGAYQSDALAKAFKDAACVLEGNEKASLLCKETQCRVLVCSFAKNMNKRTLFRSYTVDTDCSSGEASACTIWEAARATSAAATFFDPLIIGSQSYVDGATGLNNPVEAVLDEAKSIWPDALSNIQCIVSIGTGIPQANDFGDNLKGIAQTLKVIATDTEETHRKFLRIHGDLGLQDRYFRFNVVHGLADVKLDDHGKIPKIEAATEAFINSPEAQAQVAKFLATPFINPEYLPSSNRDSYFAWLSCIDQQHQLDEALIKSSTDTSGLWFVHRYFEEWRESPGTIFWTSAPAGAGETVLASILIEKIKDLGLVAYYYCSFQNKESQSLRQLKHALLVQLLKGLSEKHPHKDRVFIPRAFQELRKKVFPSHNPSMDDLDRTIISLSSQVSPCFIMVDALDECESQKTRQEILNFLSQLIQSGRSSLHIMVFSRPEIDIQESIAQLPVRVKSISLDSGAINSDIVRHLEALMDNHPYKAWAEDIKREVRGQIAEQAHGNFRWADLQIESVRGKSRVVDVRKALKRLPHTLGETYERMLQRIELDDYRMEALAVFRWLCVQQRPMRLKEISELVALEVCEDGAHLEPTSNDYELSFVARNRFPTSAGAFQILAGLITLNEGSPKILSTQRSSSSSISPSHNNEQLPLEEMTVSFSHFSVLEYLQSENVRPPVYRLRLSDCHWFVAKACLAYIHNYDMEKTDEIQVGMYPLLSYACFNLCKHLSTATGCDAKMDVETCSLLLGGQTSGYGYATRLTAILTDKGLEKSALQIPRYLCDARGDDRNLKTGSEAQAADPELLRLIIEAGYNFPEDIMFDAVRNCRDSSGQSNQVTPNGLKHVNTDCLVMKENFTDRPVPIGVSTQSLSNYQTAWDLILQYTSPNLNATDRLKQTVLLSAALQGDLNLFLYLWRQKDVIHDCKDVHGWSTLICAIIGAEKKIVKHVLNYGNNDLKQKDSYGWTAVDWAMYQGFSDLIPREEKLTSRNGSRTARFSAHIVTQWRMKTEVWSVSFSYDRKKLAVCCCSGKLMIISLVSNEIEGILLGHDYGLKNAAWSPDDSMIVTYCTQGRVVLWDIKTQNKLLSLNGFTEPVSGSVWALDGKTLWLSTLSFSENFFRVSLDTGIDSGIDQGDRNLETELDIKFSSSSIIASIQKVILPISERIDDIAVSLDGRHLVVMTFINSLFMLSTGDWEVKWRHNLLERPCSVTIDQNSKFLLVSLSSGGHDIRYFDDGALLHHQPGAGSDFVRRGHFGGLHDEFVLRADGDGYISVWETNSGDLLGHLSGHHPYGVNSIVWKLGSTESFATCGDDGMVKM